jgi:GNAT superfamily N-acetyltransferase
VRRELDGGVELDDDPARVDVYVLPEFRGRGLGVELVREIVDGSPFADRKWLLHTADAHELYAKLGFGPPSERVLERQ